MKKVLLYSGGMDSWIIDKLWKPDVKLFFRIYTKNNDIEFENIDMEDVTIVDMDISQFEQKENNYFMPLRNLQFVVHACHYGDIICLGSVGGSVHRDNNETFGILTETLINYLLSEDKTREGKVQVYLPYMNTSKTDLLKMYLDSGGDIEECYTKSFSCYSPTDAGNECGMCSSCASKFTAFYNNGYPFEEWKIMQFLEGMKTNNCGDPDAVKLYKELSGKYPDIFN